jgi:hypothetical protein
MSLSENNEHLRFKIKPLKVNLKFHCKTCGRHCKVLVNGNCSFCHERYRAIVQSEKHQNKQKVKEENYFAFCSKCGNRTTKACFERTGGLCGYCNNLNKLRIKRLKLKNEKM